VSLGASGGEGERSRLDLARQHTEEAAKAYRRAVRLAAARGAPRGVRASKAEFFRWREALAAELERVGAARRGLPCRACHPGAGGPPGPGP
jgi:hypothetical protein